MHHWLTVLFDEPDKLWPESKGHRVVFSTARTVQEAGYTWSFRTSPIFPLRENFIQPNLDKCFICFYCFNSAFVILGRLSEAAFDNLARSLWYSVGLASVILISSDESLTQELLSVVQCTPISMETWRINHEIITDDIPSLGGFSSLGLLYMTLPKYSTLPVEQRAVVDEFLATLAVVVPKIAAHLPAELEAFVRLTDEIGQLVTELCYISNPEGPPPKTLDEYDGGTIKKDAGVRQRISQQAIDRIIQVNSALSYVSTQMLSGAPPILERRSLIRRHSLLGVG